MVVTLLRHARTSALTARSWALSGSAALVSGPLITAARVTAFIEGRHVACTSGRGISSHSSGCNGGGAAADKRRDRHPLMRADWDPNTDFIPPRRSKRRGGSRGKTRGSITRFKDAAPSVDDFELKERNIFHTTQSPTTAAQREETDDGADALRPASYRLLRQAPVEEAILSQIEKVHGGLRKRSRLHSAKQAIEKELERNELAREMFNRNHFQFECSIGSVDELHAFDREGGWLVEFCFCGRSNVGKSSLINNVMGGGKAYVSNRPGETRTVNFYRMGNAFRAVDLPGYGFAFASEERSQQWIALMETYIKERSSDTLRRVFVLIDSRHGLKRSDIQFLQFLNRNRVSNQIVMTKNDLVDPEDLAKQIYIVQHELRKLRHTQERILLCSSETKSGILDIQKTIMSMLGQGTIASAQQRINKRKAKEMKQKIQDASRD